MEVNNLYQDTIFGIRDDKIIHISEIMNEERGLKCNCICVKCHNPLVAKMGNIREHHFSHYSNFNCKGSFESAIHLFAKEIFSSANATILPKQFARYFIRGDKVRFYINPKNNVKENNQEIMFAEEHIYEYDKVEIEYRVDDIIADVVLYKNGKPLIVEIKVSHEVDELKLEKIRKINIPAIEIDLSEEFKNFTNFDKSILADILLRKSYLKNWLHNPAFVEYLKEFKIEKEKELRFEIEKQKKEENRKIKHEMMVRENKIEKIKFLYDPDNQKNIRTKWSNDFENDILWIEANRYTKFDNKCIPEFLNTEIEGDVVFNCDRRIWQTKIFSSYIYNWKLRKQKSSLFSIERLVDWVKNKSGIPLNWDLVYTMDISDELPGVKSLPEVLFEFMINLHNHGFVAPTEKSLIKGGNCYYWWFEKLDQEIEGFR